MTQSVPALREAVKSAVPKDTVDALLNNFQTKIMHTCTDYTTQVWAAEIIGKGLQWEWSDNWGGSQGANWSAGDSTTLGNTASTSEQRGQGSSHNKSWGWHWFWGKSVTPDNSARGSNLSYSDGSSTGTSYATGTNRSRGASTGSSWGRSKRQKIDFFVQPSFFSSGLRTGGERHGFQVDGVMMQGGRIWRCNGSSFVKCTFSQE
jgi:hypothetical protein